MKYSGFLTRLPHLSIEQFQAHWRDVHGPLVSAEFTSMVRYIQSHALPETYDTARHPAYMRAPTVGPVPTRMTPASSMACLAAAMAKTMKGSTLR